MMKFLILVHLHNLRVTGLPDAGVPIAGSLRIADSPDLMAQFVDEGFLMSIGGLEAQALLGGAPFAYAITEYTFDDTVRIRTDILDRYLSILQFFLNAMWLESDNRVNFQMAYLQYPYMRPLLELPNTAVTSNTRGVVFSRADGKDRELILSSDDLRKIAKRFEPMISEALVEIPEGLVVEHPHDKDTRATRALWMLQAARAAGTAAEKIAFYCGCFEALVSSDATELAHKVSERVALVIKDDPAEGIQIYRTIKKAYNTRSKMFHGARLSSNTRTYVQQAIACDDYLRRLLSRVLDEQDEFAMILQGTANDIDEYFVTQIFEQ